MKKFILICFALNFITILHAQKNEDLLSVLQKETEAYDNADYEAWQSCWVHSENAYFSYAAASGLFVYKGWATLEATAKPGFKDKKKYDSKFRRENIKVERQGDMAFITFDQYAKFLEDDSEQHTQESRVMQKTKDGWKILSVEANNVTSFNGTGK